MAMDLVNRIAACEPKQNKFLVVTLATGTPVAASGSSVKFTKATFYGYSAVSASAGPTANAADAYIGLVDATNGTGVGAGNPVFVDTIGKGSWLGMTAPVGTKYDLADIQFLGSTGDKVVVQYEQ